MVNSIETSLLDLSEVPMLYAFKYGIKLGSKKDLEKYPSQ